MNEELRRRILYFLERILVRGAHYRLLVVIATIGIVSAVGGLLLVADGQSTEGPAEAMWWAFLRLSDPGYLGDDVGLWRRLVSTVLTVLGYVIFLGAMVAILTQWLNDTLNRLERGTTPIRHSGHVAILGWTNRTRMVCQELVTAEGRLSRWLELRGVRSLRLAILAEELGPEHDLELRAALGNRYRRQNFVLRSGSTLNPRHLERVDLIHAASIVLPGIESTSERAVHHDATVIKTLSAITAEHRASGDLPPCVCEIFDPRRVAMAELAYGGPLEVLASDVIIGRVLSDSLREPGSSSVLDELLTHGTGGTMFLRTWRRAPTSVREIIRGTPGAILLGVAGESSFRLTADGDEPVMTDDALVYVAPSYEATEWREGVTRTRPQPLDAAQLVIDPPSRGGRVLILGWSRRIPDLLAQLDSHLDESWTTDVLSIVPPERREADIREHGVDLQRIELTHRTGDLTIPTHLAAVEPNTYDRVYFVASDWPTTGYASDARTLATYMALRTALAPESPPPILVEVTDDASTDLFDAGHAEVVVSPQILSRLLAQVVLRRRLRLVIDEIFGEGASQLRFVTPRAPDQVRFGALAATLRAQGTIAIGVRRGDLGGELVLAPTDELELDFRRGDAVVVLTRRPAAPSPAS